ncbi:MAG: hypothetical protein K2W82_08395 [Candidatus Obscuribacterales bacterium]|nr:hypothetical protein [Candidatus Obscuribacterales bacterium]
MSFLDDVAKNVNEGLKQVNDGINKIQSKSQEMMQTVTLQNRINSLAAKKSIALADLGRLIYDKYAKNDEVGEDLLKRRVDEIVDMEKEIESIKAELGVIKAQYDPDLPRSEKSEAMAGYSKASGCVCPHCKAPANQEKQYCAFCGGNLKETEA